MKIIIHQGKSGYFLSITRFKEPQYMLIKRH